MPMQMEYKKSMLVCWVYLCLHPGHSIRRSAYSALISTRFTPRSMPSTSPPSATRSLRSNFGIERWPSGASAASILIVRCERWRQRVSKTILPTMVAPSNPLSRPCRSAHAFWRVSHKTVGAPTQRSLLAMYPQRLHVWSALRVRWVAVSRTKLSPERIMSTIAEGRTASRSLRNTRA